MHNTDTETNEQIEAELVHITAAAYAWVERDQPFDRDALARSVDRFSTRTYPALRNAFGSEWNPGVDGDPRLHILFNRAMGNSAVGYYYSADEYTAPVRPLSNQKEIFFINLDWVNGMRSQELAQQRARPRVPTHDPLERGSGRGALDQRGPQHAMRRR